MNKVSKIEQDRIKQGCSCEFFQGRSHVYKTKECKSCLHKQGISSVKKHQEEIQAKKDYESERLLRKIMFRESVMDALFAPPTQLKLNWFQKLIYM